MENTNYGLEDFIRGEGSLIGSDYHGNDSVLESDFQLSRERDLVLLLNGDYVNDYGFDDLSNRMGYKSQQQHRLEFFANELSQDDFQTYMIAMQMQQFGGVDGLLSHVAPEHQKEAKGQLEYVMDRLENDQLFHKRLENLNTSLIEQKGFEIMNDSMNQQILYFVFMDEEAKKFASMANKYSDVKVGFNLGNHENSIFIEQVRGYLDNPDQIIDLTNKEGYTVIRNSEGIDMSIAAMTNCVHTMPHLSDILPQDQYELMTSHQHVDDIKRKTIMVGEQSIESLEQMYDLIKQDKDYQRVKSGNEDIPLDVFLSHGQIGSVFTSSGRGHDVPYFGAAAQLSLEARLTVEGHLHNKFDGKNSFGSDMIRAAGEDAVILTKDKDGNLKKEWIKRDEDFDGNHNNPIPYSIEYLKERIEQIKVDNNIVDITEDDVIETKAA